MPRGVSPLDEARLQGRLWTPDLIRNLFDLWLDAADLSTISAPNGVDSWRDKSGKGKDAVQATVGNRPVWGTFQLNGLPLVSTTNSPARFLQTAAFTPAAGFDFFWVTTSDGAAQAGVNTIFDHDHAAARAGQSGQAAPGGNWVIQADNLNYGMGPNTTTHYVAPFLGTNFRAPPIGGGSNGISTGGPTLGLFRNRGTAGDLFSAGNLRDTGAFTSAMTRDSRAFRLSGGVIPTATGREWRGGYGEVIYTNVTLSTPDVRRMEGYLAHKWGLTASLPATHPYRNRPPLIGD
jgi:hypothetical protein